MTSDRKGSKKNKKEMKTARLLVVLLQTEEDGICYQVALSEEQMNYIRQLISIFHDGSIKVFPTQHPFTLAENKKS